MKATIDTEGYLKLDMQSVIAALSDEHLRTFAKYAVFQEHLLRGILDALVEGQMWTGEKEEPPWWFGGDTFNALRLKLLPLLPEITTAAVQHLECELRRARSTENQWRDACYALMREWPEGPRPERWPYSDEQKMTKEQAIEYLRKIEQQLADQVTPQPRIFFEETKQ